MDFLDAGFKYIESKHFVYLLHDSANIFIDLDEENGEEYLLLQPNDRNYDLNDSDLKVLGILELIEKRVRK